MPWVERPTRSRSARRDVIDERKRSRTARDFFCKYIGRRRGGARRRNRSKSHRARRHFPPRDGNGAIFGRTASRRDEIFRREGRSRCRAPNLARGDAPDDGARPRRIGAATGHAFERRRSRGAPAVDAGRGRGQSASFQTRTRRRTSDSRRARRPPGRRSAEKWCSRRRRARLGRSAARANARGRMAPSSGARRRGAMRFSGARDDRGAARRTSRAATRPTRAFSVNRRRRRASSIDRSRLNAGKNARGGQKCPRRAKMPAAGKNARSGQKCP